MIAVILFQINILTLTLFSVFMCAGRKKSYDGEGDVSLVQPGVQRIGTGPTATSSSTALKPANDDFSVGVPPPHIPLADKSDERTLADIESIQSEKAMIREKKSKLAASASKSKLPPNPQSPGTSADGSKIFKGARSPSNRKPNE